MGLARCVLRTRGLLNQSRASPGFVEAFGEKPLLIPYRLPQALSFKQQRMQYSPYGDYFFTATG